MIPKTGTSSQCIIKTATAKTILLTAPTGRTSASIAMTTSTAEDCSEIILMGRQGGRVEDGVLIKIKYGVFGIGALKYSKK